ncbi:ComF family protein [Croceicoccus naphthovorans]|uniref:Amidophosphoribosyltransferase n=1 Tax=Croceicoccus naphthovorans TaxID=1348774 RepID=A0A0G3XHI7_9SPHN|nr:ComF family protein [Croceicoccus naphthovorans]AKM10066.1 hypothetical protein AB433_08895 [Croceicoccus naphthovorans]
MSLRKFLSPLIDFAFPPRCPGCGDAIVADGPNGDDAFCTACWTTLQIPGEPACAECQHPFGADHLGHDALCARCLIDPPMHDGIVAATIYGSVSRDMVLKLKHGGRIALVGPMGRTLASRIGDKAGHEPIVVPVPLHRGRLWRRGYNQSVLMARAIAKAKGWALQPDLLVRKRRTPSLGGLDPDQRRKALRGAIAMGKRSEVKGRTVLLVDDVLTSGATSDACVRVLKKAGAERVVIACYARVLHADPVPKRETPEAARPRASA